MAFGRPHQVATHRYGRVLAATAIVVVAIIALPDDDLGQGLALAMQGGLLTMVTIAARDATGRMLTGLAILSSVLGALSAIGVTLPGWLVLGLGAVLPVAMIFTMVRGLLTHIREDGVDLQAVAGGLTMYLLVGIAFAQLVGAVAVVANSFYFAQGTDGTSGDRIYFSFVTLTTTGYGDLTPRLEVGRALSVLEVLTGQIYLVVVVALLVGNLRRRGG
jgi:hypothetical protein